MKYVKTYEKKPSTIRIGEYDVPLPKMPPKKHMVNYGKPVSQQKYKRLVVPEDIRTWDENKEKEFVSEMWHIRLNGRWHLIKGEPIYVTGAAEVFFSFWYTERGSIADFRMEAQELFLWWDMIERDPDALGGFIIKPRRIGETEKFLFLMWECATRYSSTRTGMQHMTDEDAKKSFQRMCRSAKKMVYFFKPMVKGREDGNVSLKYDVPEESMTHKKAKQKKKDKDVSISNNKTGLESVMDYQATTHRKYDGQMLHFYYMDEAGKIAVKKMAVDEQWEIVKRTITLNNMSKVVGKAIIATTVEEIKGGGVIQMMTKMWNNSDTGKKDISGRTLTGLYRLFRSAVNSAEVDEFGFHKKEEFLEQRKISLDAMEKAGLHDEMISYKRKHCITIDEALIVPSEDCVLSPFLLDKKVEMINAEGRKDMPGDLVWDNGKRFSTVRWVPNPGGKFRISQHPVNANNVTTRNGKYIPGNRLFYKGGADPIDYETTTDGYMDKTKGRVSDVGLSIFREFNPLAEIDLKYDDQGNIENVRDMSTDRFVCTYLNRPRDMKEVFEDTLKMCWYYGCQVFIESNKRSLINEFVSRKLLGFLQLKGRHLYTNQLSSKVGNEIGAAASSMLIEQYVDALKCYVNERWEVIEHLDLLKQMRMFNIVNRKDLDLVVASGFAKIACNPVIKEQEETKGNWESIPFRKHKRAI